MRDIFSTIIILLLLLPSITTQIQQPTQTKIQKIVWVYIEQIQNINILERLCLDNIKYYSEQSSYQFRLITYHNYTVYLQKIQQTNISNTFINKNTIIKSLIQLEILHQYGGIWLNIPIILTQSFSWLETIKNQKFINNRIDSPNVVFFYSPQWFEQTFKRTTLKIQNLVIKPLYHSWFIAIKQGCHFIKDWKTLYLQILHKSPTQLKHFYSIYNLNDQNYILNHQYFLQWTAQTVIHIKQYQLDQHYGTISSSRRLAINNYQITAINVKETSSLIDQSTNSYTHLSTKYYLEIPYTQFHINYTYLLKIQTQLAEEISSIIDQDIPLIQHLHSSVQLICTNQNIPYRHIINNSIIDKYLLNKSKNIVIKTYSEEFIQHYCSVTYTHVFYQIIIGYLLPLLGLGIYLYIVRRSILIFRPEWGIRRKRRS